MANERPGQMFRRVSLGSAQRGFAVTPIAAVSVALGVHDGGVGLRRIRRVEDGPTSGAQIIFIGLHTGRDARNVRDFIRAQAERIGHAGVPLRLRPFKGSCARRSEGDGPDQQDATDRFGREEKAINAHDAPPFYAPQSRAFSYITMSHL